MAFDRNKLEQQALKFQQRGQLDKAIDCYKVMLRRDTRDRRARQKLAELYHRDGRKADSFHQFQEVARLHTADGNHRSALAIYKQLNRMRPGDSDLRADLADSYYHAGFRAEAAPHYRKAFEELASNDAKKALVVGRKLLRIQHDDVSLRVTMGAILERCGEPEKAMAFYLEAVAEYRRRGQSSEVARVARIALRVDKDQPELLADAAEACLASGERAEAMGYLKAAYKADPRAPKVLELLARAIEQAGVPAKARPVLLELAAVHEQEGNHPERVLALEKALSVGDPSPEIARMLGEAREQVERQAFRLTSLASSSPADDAELRLCTRAEVFQRYGFSDRVAPEVDAQLATTTQSIPLLAWAAELAVDNEDTEAAVARATQLVNQLSGQERQDALQRLISIGGDPTAFSSGAGADADADADDELIDDELVDDELLDDELLDDELLDDEELVEDEATDARGASPDPEVAPAPEAAPAPSDDGFGDLFSQTPAAEAGADLFADVFSQGGTYAEIDPNDPALVRAANASGLEEARGMLGMGLFEEALSMLEGAAGVEAAALKARCLRELGQVDTARRVLKDVLLDSADDAPGLDGALFEYAELAGRSGQRRVALRCLHELAAFHPEHRAGEVSARIKALERVLGG